MSDELKAAGFSSFITLHSDFCISFELVFQRPRHQALDRGACALAFVEHRVNLARYRYLDAAQLCQKFYGSRRAHALRDLVHAREHLVELPTPTQFVSDVAAVPRGAPSS